MEKIFSIICKDCAKKDDTCCNCKLFLVRDEVEKIKKFKPDLKYKKDRTGFTLIRNKKDKKFKCQFLTDKGCILPKELKPLDCFLFPLVFKEKNGESVIYMNKNCPSFKLIPQEWIESTKKISLEKLKNWTEEEKVDYSKCLNGVPENKLVEV